MDATNTNIKIRYTVIARRTKTKNGGYHLFIRIKMYHLYSEFKTKVYIQTKQEIEPSNGKPKDINKYSEIQGVIDKLKSIGLELERNGLLKHPSQITEAFKGKPILGLNFLETFFEFIEHQESQVLTGNLAQGTMKNYYTTQRYLIRFVKEEYRRKDIPMNMFDRRFVDRLSAWLTVNTVSTNNGRKKHFERIKRFVTVQMDYGFIKDSPFRGFIIQTKENPRTYLTEEELIDIRELDLGKSNLAITRDMFLFMCNTGLAFSDLIKIDLNDITHEINGKMLNGVRQKTNVSFLVPITSEAEQIIEKYKNHKISIEKGTLLPVFTNQVFNDHLKIIAKRVGLTKNLSSHVARHTFATLALTSGVPQVTIQRVLGHTDQRMTQHYSRLIDKKLVADMKAFKKMIDRQTNHENPAGENENQGVFKLKVV